MRIDFRDDFADQRHRLEVVDLEQAGVVQPVVDVVGVVSDVVGERRNLGLERRKTPAPDRISDCNRKCPRECRFRCNDQPGPTSARPADRCVDDPSVISQVRLSPSNSAIAVSSVMKRAASRIVVKAAIGFQALVQRPLAGMAERRVAEIVRQRQRFRQVLVETELACQRTADRRLPANGSAVSGSDRPRGTRRHRVLCLSRRNAVEWITRSQSRRNGLAGLARRLENSLPRRDRIAGKSARGAAIPTDTVF